MDFFSEKELSIRFSGVDRNEDWALSQEEYLNDVGSSFAWHCVPCPMNTFKANLGNQIFSTFLEVSRKLLPLTDLKSVRGIFQSQSRDSAEAKLIT